MDSSKVNLWKSVPGWLTDAEAHILQVLAYNKVCLEIGSYLGKSTVCMAAVAKKVVAIEPHNSGTDGQKVLGGFTTLFQYANHVEPFSNITSIIGISDDVLPLLAKRSFDFIFIDGLHTYEQVTKDYLNSIELLGGHDVAIAFHDYETPYYDGIKKFVKELPHFDTGVVVDSLIYFHYQGVDPCKR